MQGVGALKILDGSLAPEFIHNGIPYDAGGSVIAVDDGGVIDHHHQGLPFTATSRLAVDIDGVVATIEPAAMPLTAAGLLALGTGATDHFNSGVPYTAAGQISLSDTSVSGPPAANLEIHYQFNTGITVAGQGVSVWADQSGAGRDLLQGTDANRPSEEVDGSILFDGIATFLASAGFTWNQPETVYLLAKQVTWTTNEYIFDANSNTFGTLRQRTASPRVSIQANLTVAENSDWILDTYAAVCCVFNGAGSLIQVDNNTPTTGDAGLQNMGGIVLGANTAGTIFSNIQVKEVLGYSVAHDQATRDSVIAYLNSL